MRKYIFILFLFVSAISFSQTSSGLDASRATSGLTVGEKYYATDSEIWYEAISTTQWISMGGTQLSYDDIYGLKDRLNNGDASTSNEGSLSVSAGTGSTSVINSNTSGSTAVTLEAGTNVTLSESSNTITIASNQTSVTGNAGTATALQNARTINGTSFDGTANITVTAAAGTLTGGTLNSGVTASSLTSVGTISSGTWNGSIIDKAYGGTAEDNSTGGTANTFWARPNGASGAATYRVIVAEDIPTLNQNTTGSAATLTTARKINGVSFNGSADVNVDNNLNALLSGGSPFLATTFELPLIQAQTSTALVDNTVRFVAVYLPKAATITGIKVYVRVLGNYTGDNNNRVGLYTYSGGTLTLVASSTNSGTLWTSAANAFQTIAFSGTYSASAGLYFVGLLYNQSAQTTAPTLAGGAAFNNQAMVTYQGTNSIKFFGTLAGQNDLPSSQASSGITGSTASYWIALY